MNLNEFKMILKGQKRVWSEMLTKDGNDKKIASTQIGQQLIMKEAQRIAPLIKDWVNNGSAKMYRLRLKEYLGIKDDSDDDVMIVEKVAHILFIMLHHIYLASNPSQKKRWPIISKIAKEVFPELEYNLSWQIIEVIVDTCDFIEYDKIVYDKGGKYPRGYYKISESFNEEILEKISLLANNAFYEMPMLEPPIPWRIEDGKAIGGYREKQIDLIRGFISDKNYDKIDQRVLDAINYIQAQPWRINERLLHTVENDLKEPQKSEFSKFPFPQMEEGLFDLDLDDKKATKGILSKDLAEIRDKRREYMDAIDLWKSERFSYESAVGKFRAVKLAVEVAKDYVGKVIYMPHSFDFRGRVYPVPIGAQPQGSDAIKAILEYAEGEVLTERGEQWAWAYLASLYGDDKLPFEERVARGKTLIDVDYTEADEPYQFLAHQIELEKFLDNKNYKFNGRVHLDACNSGSQFASAITGDLSGCLATNVIVSRDDNNDIIRQDAYMLVADKAVEECDNVLKKAKKEFDKLALENVPKIKELLIENGRKICKQPVMVSNYGGTPGGRMNILYEYLRDNNIDRKYVNKRVAGLMSRIIGDSIQGVLTGGKAFEQYIHQMNNLIAAGNKGITWTTDDGFFVTHKKYKMHSTKFSVHMPSSRKKVTINVAQSSNDTDNRRMKMAISPNYIHSLDAELLRKVALRMKEIGIKDSDWIHDSFGCHPNYVDDMLRITKEEFLAMIKRNPLDILHKELVAQLPRNIQRKRGEVPRIPKLNGLESDMGNELVMDSDWFFS